MMTPARHSTWLTVPLLLGQLLLSLPVSLLTFNLAVAQTTTVLGDNFGGDPTKDTGSGSDTSLFAAFQIFSNQSNELRFLIDLLTKNMKFSPVDREYLENWALVSRSIKKLKETDPETYQKFVDSNYLAIPPKIQEQYQDILPLPNYHKWMLEALWLRMEENDPDDPENSGFGGEFLDVSRITADYDNDNRLESKEGEEGKPAEQEKNISSHAFKEVHAFDVAAIDYIRCTKVTFKPEGTNSKKLKITKREKLNPTEIEVAWQDNPPGSNSLGTYPSGANDANPNLLTNLFGASFDDLMRRLGKDGVTSALLKVLGDGGFNVTPEALRLIDDWNGESNDLSTIFARLGQALTLSGLPGTTTEPIFPVGATLDQTINFMGAALLTNLFPKLTITALQSQSLDEVGEKLAREGLGRQFLGSGYKLEGNSSQELFTNLAAQYFTGKILGLQPTTSLTSFPLTNQTEIKQAIGTIAVSQRLLLALDQIRQGNLPSSLGNRFQSQFVDQASDTDRLLGVATGTTATFAANPSAGGFAQFAQTVGADLLAATVDQYLGADPLIKNRAMNLNLQFGPEDLYLPDERFYPTTFEQLAEIERLYRPMINDAAWLDFARRYKASTNLSGFTDALDEESEIRDWLANHLVRQPDLLGLLTNGPITTETLTDVGRQVVAKIDPKPFNQLALLKYFATGTILTVPTTGIDYQVPVLNIASVGTDRLGLLNGDFERIFGKNRFTTDVLPRLAGDYLSEALNNVPKDSAFLSGTGRQVLRTDDFLVGGLANLDDSLKELKHLTPAATSAVTEIRTIISQTRPEDWQLTPNSSREERIGHFLNTLGARLPELTTSVDTVKLRPVLRDLASLVAGRIVATPADLTTPTAPLDRSIGLTKDLLGNFIHEKVTPAEFIGNLGAQFLTANIWSAAKPEVMANDLRLALNRSSDPNYTDFFNKYSTNFSRLARQMNGQLGLLGPQTGLDGQAVFGIFTGNSQGLFSRVLGTALNQSFVGQPGNIWGSTTGPADILGAIGLRQVFQANGFVGRFDFAGDLTSQITQKIFEQRSGLLWTAGGAVELLGKNGANFPNLLNFPSELKQQFTQLWNPQNPQKVIDGLLKNPAVWQQLNISNVMQNNLGPAGGAAANALVSMFTSGGQSQDLLGAIKNNINGFLPIVSHSLNLPVDLGSLYRAIQANDRQSILGSLTGLGGSLIDSRLTGLSNILLSNDKSPKTVMNWVTGNLPTFLGGSANPTVINFAQTLGNYFFDNTITDPTQKSQLLQAAAGQMGQLLHVPYAADLMKLASDPRGYGLTAIGSVLSARLGLPEFGYTAIRATLFGPDAKQIQEEAVKIRLANPGFTEKQITDQAKKTVEQVTKQVQKDMQYTLMDQSLGIPWGTAKAMLEGGTNAKLDALFGAANQFLNVPPEARIALELLKNKGDLSQISNATFGYLDGQLSNLTGVPLPPGFTQTTADLFAGKITSDQYSNQFSGFAVGQVSGFLDQKLGVPVGTTYTVYSVIDSLNQANAAVEQITNSIMTDGITADKLKAFTTAQANLTQIEAAGAGLVVNLVFGKEIAGLEKSLGLPPGTASFLINTAIQSLYSNTAFLSLAAASLPLFAAGLLLGPLLSGLFGNLGGLFGGGGDQEQKVTICTAGGYYPYVKKEDDEKENNEGLVARYYDPYSDLDHYRSIEDRAKEKKPEQVVKELGIWPGFPGEFYGEEVSPQAYAQAKQAAARWKVRQLLGELLLMRGRYDQTALLPRQLIAYDIPKTSRDKDGDYLKYYDGRETSDPRFIENNIGIIDWPFFTPKSDDPILTWWKKQGEIWGYGNGKPGSGNAKPEDGDPNAKNSLAQTFYGIWNVGLWTESTSQFAHHIHAGY